MPITRYTDLIVWQKAKSVAILVYELTVTFPENEKFGLVSQIRRSAVSISANIAEGKGRSTRKDFANFLHNALGSCFELETELSISKELKFGTISKYAQVEILLSEVQKILTAMIIKLKT